MLDGVINIVIKKKRKKANLLCCSAAGKLQSHRGKCPRVRLHDQVKVGLVHLDRERKQTTKKTKKEKGNERLLENKNY